jgi:hypothetical protein
MQRKVTGTAIGVLLAGGLAGAAGMNELDEMRAHALSLFQGRAKAAGQQTTFSTVEIVNSGGRVIAALLPDDTGDGAVGVANSAGDPRAIMDVSPQNVGRVYVFNNVGRPTFVIDGIAGVGAASGDLAEMFPAKGAIQPGSVVVIDAEHRGAMSPSSVPYDRRVAGVAAGANNYRSAITLRAMEGTEGKVPVTLTGTAYCLASNANGEIKAGDLLTTSSVPGHAMKVTDHEAARGAILGKALEDLKGDKGHILILASLQ